MKFPKMKMSLEGFESPVDSVQDWLNQELEQHGIDSRVYTRVIISMLRHGGEPEGSECEDDWDHNRITSQDPEDRRKRTTVEFLLGLADSRVEMTSLVDELSMRLKSSSQGAVSAPLHVELEREKEIESADPTEKYYAAFPALTGESTPAVSPSSAEGDNIWCGKLARQLAGETHEKQDTYPNGVGSEAGDTPSGKLRCSQIPFQSRMRFDRRGFEPKVYKIGRKKYSMSGKKRPSMESSGGGAPSGSWLSDRRAPPSVAAIMPSEKSEKCMQIEAQIKEMLFRNRGGMVTNQNREPNAGQRVPNPTPELQENDQWYKRPMDEIIITSSLSSEPLYQRCNYPTHRSSLQDAGYRGVLNIDFLDSPTQSDTLALMKSLNDDPSLISALPDYDSGKDSAVVSDGDLSSAEEDLVKEKTPSIEICFAALLQSHRADFDKRMSSGLEVARPQLDEEDSSREPSLGSQEDETIFHLELDENEITPAQRPRGEHPIDFASMSEPRMRIWEAYSSARTFGKDQCLEGPRHSVAPLQEVTPETGKDLGYSSEHLQSFVEEPLAKSIDIVIEDTAAEDQLDIPALDGIPLSADCLPTCLRNDLAAGEKSAQGGAAGTCPPTDMWNALNEKKFPEDATSLCPSSSYLPTRDWSDWSQSLGLGLGSTLGPCSTSGIEPPFQPPFRACQDFNQLPWERPPPDTSYFLWKLFDPEEEDTTSFQTSSLLPSDRSSTTTSQDWDLSSHSQIWSSPRPSYDWNGRQSFSADTQNMLGASTRPIGDQALLGGGNEGNLLSPLVEKSPRHLWDVNTSQKSSPGWSIWTGSGFYLPLHNDTHQQARFSSTSQLPDADGADKTETENAGTSYNLFPSISTPGNLVCYQREMPFGNNPHGLSESLKLNPSEKSAFRPYIRCSKSLLHVHSTPNMKFSLPEAKRDQENSSSDVSEEHLLQSRFFRPIQTPLSTPEDEQEFQPLDLWGGYSSQGSQYQRYRDPKKSNPVEEFQPQFKVQQDFDKNIQTSLDDKEETPSAAMMAMPYHYDPFSSREESGNFTDAFHDGEIKKPLDDLMTQASFEPKEVPAEPWMDSSNVSQGSISQQSEQHSCGNSILGFSSRIWSSGYDHDQDVPASGAEFPVTPLLSVSSTQSYSEHLAQGQAPLDDDVFYPCSVSYCQDAMEPPSHPPEAVQDAYQTPLVPIPDQAVYSSDLERKWQSESEARQSKTISCTKSAKTSTNKKPCSYYIEGRCPHTNCKYSHELSGKTCRFWVEKRCFRGDSCRFRHGFPSESDEASPLQSQASPEFSDLDFPVLGRNGNNVGHPEK